MFEIFDIFFTELIWEGILSFIKLIKRLIRYLLNLLTKLSSTSARRSDMNQPH
jgi:hypothetical protein